MAELSGKDYSIKISGAAVYLTGETTTSVAGDLVYQITDTVRRILDRTGSIWVHKKGTNDTAEAGTTTTNIKMTAHGLVNGDLIINTTHAGVRTVTRVDADNVTVIAVTGQTTSDTIEIYKTEPATAYTLNRLNGKVTYLTNVSRVIKISGSYLPMTTAAYANSSSTNKTAEVLDVTTFGLTHKKRIAGLKSASGTLSQFDVADTTYSAALTAGVPIVIESRTVSTEEPDRFWALLESDEVKAAVDGVQDETVSWVSYDAWINLGV